MRKNGCCKRVIALSTIVAVMFLTACGNSSAKSEGTYMAESDITTDNAYMTDEYDIAAESKMTAAGESNEPAAEKYQETVNLSAEKIIYTGNVSIKTKSFEKTVSGCKAMMSSYKGIIETENYNDDSDWYEYGFDDISSRNRSYYVTVRVPSDKYNDFMSETGNLDGLVESKESSAQNISQQYSDASIELESYQAEFKRLQELMQQAQEMDDIIAIEQQMTSVRTQINQLKSDLRRMDTSVAYSTVNITIREVSVREIEQPEEQTYFRRLAIAFRNSISNFGDFIIGFTLGIVEIWPFLLVIALIIIAICKHRKNKKKKETSSADKSNKKEE